MKKLVAFITCLMISFSAAATTDRNMTVVTTGVQGGSSYITLSPALSGTCLYGVLYLSNMETSPFARAMYATLLTAVSSGKPLARVDYAPDASGVCFISLLEV